MGKKKRQMGVGNQRSGAGGPAWQRAIFWLVALLVVVTPFLFNPWLLLGRAYDLFYAIKDAFVFSLFILIGGIRTLRMIWATDARDVFRLPQSRLVRIWEGSLLLFLALAFFSGWESDFHLLFAPPFVALALGTVFYFALSRSLCQKALHSLLLLQSGVGTLVGLHLLSQRAGFDPVLWLLGQNPAALASGQLYGLMGQPLVVGGYLPLCLALTAGFLGEVRSQRRFFLAVCLAVQLAGLLVTGNRGGTISALIGLGVMAALALWVQQHLSWQRRLPMAGGGVLLLAAGVALSLTLSSSYNRLEQFWTLLYQGRWQETLGSRPEVWRLTARMALDKPFWGHGLGSFSRTHPHYKLRYSLQMGPYQGELYLQAHNEYLQVWAEMGTPALLVVIVALTSLLWQGVRVCRQAPPSERLYYCGLCGALCSILTASFVSFPLRVSSTSVPILLVAAAVARSGGLASASQDASPARKSRNAIGLRAGLTLAVVIGMVFLLRYVNAPFRASLAQTLGDRFILAAEQDQYPPEVKRSLAQEALPHYQLALAINPLSLTAYNGLGICYLHLGDYEKAKAAFEKAIEIWPAGGIYFNLALAYYHLSQLEEAQQALRASESLQSVMPLSAEDHKIVAEIRQGQFKGKALR